MSVSRSVRVEAPAQQVWELVSDLPQMGRFSPEATGGRWTRGGGPVAGAVFTGTNRTGARRWSTKAKVVQAAPGKAFAFEVSALGLPGALWSYEIETTPSGCRVTESWQDRRGTVLRTLGGLVTGRPDREGFTGESIEQTLAAVKAHAEARA